MEEVKIPITLDDSGASTGARRVIGEVERMSQETSTLAERVRSAKAEFDASVATANRLKAELKSLAEGGASAEELMAKMRDLGEAQKKAAADGLLALDANRQYWTALLQAGEDISTVRTRHGELSDSYKDMAGRAKETQAMIEKYSQKLKEAANHTERLENKTREAASGQKDFSQALGKTVDGAQGLPGPVGEAASRVGGLTKASLRFIATPLGATLAAISAVLATVTSWFKRTEEGQDALAVGSAYFTQVLESLMDVADDVGEWLYKAFTKPKGALEDLVSFLKGQVINRLKAVGEMAGGIWKILNGDFTAGYTQYINGAAQGLTGVQNMTGKVGAWMASTNKKAMDRQEIARRQNALDKDERKHLVEKAKLEQRISELRGKAYDMDLKAGERQKANREAQRLTSELYDKEVSLARRRYEIIRDTNALGHSNKEDKRREADAEAELYRIETQRAQAQRGLMREGNRLGRESAGSASTAAKKIAEEDKERADRQAKERADELKFQDELARLKKNAQEAQTAATIAAIKDDGGRERAERKAQYEKSKADIESQTDEAYKAIYEMRRKAYETANKGKRYENDELGKEGWQGVKGTAYNDKEQEILDAWVAKKKAELAKLDADYARQEDEEASRLIKAHQSYTDRKIEIDRDYQAESAKIDAAIQDAQAKGDTETVEALKRSKAELLKEHAEEHSKLSLDILKEDPEYIRAFEDLDNTSTETLEHLIKMFEEAKAAAAQSLDEEQLRAYTSTLQQMYDKVSERNPFKAMADSLQAYRNAQHELDNAKNIQERVRSGEQVVHLSLDKDGNIVESYYTEAEAAEKVREKTNGLMKAQNRYNKALNSAMDSVNDMAGAITALGNSIGGEAGKIVSSIGSMMGSVTSTMQSAEKYQKVLDNPKATGFEKGMAKGSMIASAAAAGIQIGQQIASYIPTSESRHEEAVAHQKAISQMREAVEDYRLSVLRAQKEEENWFSVSGIKTLRDSYEENGKIADKYTNKIHEQQEAYQDASSGLKKVMPYVVGVAGAIVGAVVSVGSLGTAAAAGIALGAAAIGYASQAAGQAAVDALLYKERMKEAQENLRVQTQHKTLFRGEKTQDLQDWINEQEQFKSLTDEQRKLFSADERGMIRVNKELAQSILDSGATLVGQTRENLEAFIKLEDEYAEYDKNIKEYVSEMYSPLVDNMTDAIFDWLDDGEDVMDRFKEYAGDTFRTIGKDLMKNLILSNVFGEYQKQLDNLMKDFVEGRITEEEYIKRTASLFNEFTDEAEKKMPVLQKSAELYSEAMEKAGVSIKSTKEAAAQYFSDLASMWKQTLTDMTDSTTDFAREVREKIFEALAQRIYMGDDFSEWLEGWTVRMERLNDSFAQGTIGIGEYNARMEQLMAESGGKWQEIDDGVNNLKRQMGLIDKATSGLTDTIRSQFQSLFEDSTQDIGDWADGIKKIIVERLIETKLLDTAFDGWINDWLGRYEEAWDKRQGQEAKWTEELAYAGSMMAVSGSGEYTSRYATAREMLEKSEREWSETMASLDAEIEQKGGEMRGMANAFLDGFGITSEQRKEVESSLSGLESTIINSLKDTKATAEDFSRDIAKSLIEDMIGQMVKDNYGDRIKELVKAWEEALRTGDTGRMEEIQAGIAAIRNEAVEATATLAERLKELEKAGDATFSSMEGNWLNSLTDMSASAEDFTDSIRQTMAKKMVEAFVMPGMDEWLKQSQEEYNALMADETLTAEEKRRRAMAIVDKWAEKYEELRPLAEEIMEGYGLGVGDESPFDNLKDSFVSTLMDMSAKTEDFAQDIAKTMSEAMIKKFVLGEGFDRQLEQWTSRYKDIMGADGLTEQQRAGMLNALKAEIAAARDSYTEQAHEVMSLTGMSATPGDQNATVSMAEKATYDQFELYLGIATAQQMATEQGNAVRQQILATLQGMSGLTSAENPMLTEIRGLAAVRNEYLLDIKRSNREILAYLSQKLDQINNNLNRL